MTINPNFMIAPSVQEFFIDNATGLPMASGQVFFYSDVNRANLKPIYQLTGSPPNYTYTQLPNPVTLSGVGTFMDNNGNDVLPYYYPFDANNNIELYYIVALNSAGVQQFTRQAYPNFAATNSSFVAPIVNYVPNGQFLTHTQPPANQSATPLLNTALGQIPQNQPITVVAQGGWTFERPGVTSTATDLITFPLLPIADTPLAGPRYGMRIQNLVSGTDAFKYVGLKWPNVNKFSTALTSNTIFTLGFSATTNNGTSQNINILVRYFYGTNGSPTQTVSQGNVITITNSMTAFSVPINFGNSDGFFTGPNNDDYIQILFSLPPSCDITFTDVLLSPGNLINATFPFTPDADMLDQSVSGWIPTPDPNGFDNYLPMVLTPKGAKFDHSKVGTITANAVANTTLPPGYVQCDGSSYYFGGYDQTIDSVTGVATGIPFARLGNALLQTGSIFGYVGPLFGAGSGFSTACIGTAFDVSLSNVVVINSNDAGNWPAAADGTLTNISYNRNMGGMANAPDFEAYSTFANSASHVSIVSSVQGNMKHFPISHMTAAGWSISPMRGSITTDSCYPINDVLNGNFPNTGDYIQFSTPNNDWILYFNGNPPAVAGYTNILCKTLSTNASNVKFSMVTALMGFTQDVLTCPAATSIPNGSWFKFFNKNTGASGTNFYYVWFNKGGAIDPKPAGGILGIQIPLTGTETATQVAQKIIFQQVNEVNYGINTTYFAVPDLRGKFIRAHDGGAGWDIDAVGRLSNPTIPWCNNDNFGTLQYDDFLNHNHTVNLTGNAGSNHNLLGLPNAGSSIDYLVNSAGAGANLLTQASYNTTSPIGTSGTNNFYGHESRGVNIQLGYWIHL